MKKVFLNFCHEIKKIDYLNFLNILIFLNFLDLLLKHFTLGANFLTVRALAYNFVYSFLFFVIGFLFKKSLFKNIYFFLMILLNVLFAFSQHLYFRFFRDYYTFNQLSNIKEFLIVKGETTKAFDPVSLIYFVLGIISFILIVKNTKYKKRKLSFFVIGILFFVIGYSFVRVTYNNKMEDPTQDYLTDNYLHKTLFDKKKAINRFGLTFYSFRDIKRISENYFERNNPEEIKEITNYFKNNIKSASKNEMTAKFKGKNIVLILAESLNSWGINKDITPTLFKMKQDGYYFKNYYAPFFESHTIDAEFAINTGLFPSMEFGNTAYEFSKNYYPNSFANLLKKAGYQTYSYHNSLGSFYNRFQYHEALGYQHFYDNEELNIKVPPKFGYDWASDEELFVKVSDKIVKERDKNKPFLSYLITVSTHTPYDNNRKYLNTKIDYIKSKLDADSQIQYYMAAAKDLDDGIKKMMDTFEKENILKDTIFVLFGDHYSYALHHDIIWSYQKEKKNDFYELHNIPLIIYDPNNKGKQVDKLCSQFDVYPTLTNIFGLKNDATFNAGVDIFSKEASTVYFAKNNIWKDDVMLWDSSYIVKQYRNVDNPKEYANKKTAAITKRMSMFQKILKENYFRTKDYKNFYGGH